MEKAAAVEVAAIMGRWWRRWVGITRAAAVVAVDITRAAVAAVVIIMRSAVAAAGVTSVPAVRSLVGQGGRVRAGRASRLAH